jgi:hypothetical protein
MQLLHATLDIFCASSLEAHCLHVEKEPWLENFSFCIHLSKIFCSLRSQLIHKKTMPSKFDTQTD